MNKKKDFNMTDIGDIASEWKPDVVNWDLIQRMRFITADSAIATEYSYSKGEKKFEE
mgnify:CR=1 FL=1